MFACLTTLLVLLTLPVLAGGDKKDPDKSVVRTLDVKGLSLPKPTVNTKPKLIEITSAEQLAKAVPNEEAQKKIMSQVDLAKEQLVFFAWNGAPDSKVTFRVEKSDQGTAITFGYDFGFSMRLQDHHVLFAVPRGAKSKLVLTK
jgi:hypothetical protein